MSPSVQERFATILCDLLVLRPEEVTAGSLLIDDLDVDSITLLELSFTIEKEFGVKFPELKATLDTFSAPLPEALEKLETMPGAATFFEYVKAEVVRYLVDRQGSADFLDPENRERLFRSQTVETLAAAVGGRVPAGLDASAPLSVLRLNDLFRFLTVGTMAGYVAHLVKTQNGAR
jgi:acyl carrier protein